MKDVYLDYAGTTPVDSEVFKAMEPYLKSEYGNASTIFKKGLASREALDTSREKIANIMGADRSEIIFTSCATESSNLAIRGVAMRAKKEGWGSHIITTKIEHPSVLNTVKDLEKNYGFSATYLSVNEYGQVDPGELKKEIKDETVLASIMWANNEVGTIQKIKELSDVAEEVNKIREANKKHRLYFHTDAVQAVGYLDINLKDSHIDFLSATGHKFYGPKGVGFLYARRGSEFYPQITGGSQEGKKRSGTENIPYIVGMAKALESAKVKQKDETERLTKLRDKIINEITKMNDVELTGHPENRLPHIASFVIKYVEGESLLLKLDSKGISAATGSACSSDSLEPSHVLLAMGLKHEVAHGSLRISLGRYTDEGQVNYLLKELPEIVKDLREISAVKGDF